MEDQPGQYEEMVEGETFLTVDDIHEEYDLTADQLERLVDAGLVVGDLRDDRGQLHGIVEESLPERSAIPGLLAQLERP